MTTSDSPSQAALQVGQRIVVTIEDIAFGGEGVARFEQFVVFVPFVVKGEEIEVEILEVKKRFARGRRTQLVRASPDRVEPPCPYFGTCGGCQYQHVAYPVQLEWKRKQIADLFQRIGGFAGDRVEPVKGCPQPYGYRNRIMVRTQWDKVRQALNLGFIRADNRLVVDVASCRIAEPALNEQLQEVRAHPPPKGGLKVVLRILPSDWEVPADSFFQNNFHLLPGLVNTVREQLRNTGNRFLIDAYCGVGFFGIMLGDLVDEFVGVEFDRRAIEAAQRNARRHGRSNGQFVNAKAELLLPQLLQRFPSRQTTVLLDPPRTGCAPELLAALREQRVGQVIYVSCHPATQARDLNVLCGDGVFDLRTVVPLDMFPQTQHIECVADLRGGG